MEGPIDFISSVPIDFFMSLSIDGCVGASAGDEGNVSALKPLSPYEASIVKNLPVAITYVFNYKNLWDFDSKESARVTLRL